MKKIAKSALGLTGTALSAWIAGFAYEHGRKTGKENESFSPKEYLSGLGAMVGKNVVSPITKMVLERAARKTAEKASPAANGKTAEAAASRVGEGSWPF